MPLLIFCGMFGFGLSLDVKHVPVAVVLEDASPDAAELASVFELSPYFHARFVPSMELGKGLILDREVDGIIRIRPDFALRLRIGEAVVQVMAHGGDANRARFIQNYAEGAVGQWAARLNAEGEDIAGGPVVVEQRLWFNEATESRYFLVPGLVVLLMTVLGALLTALLTSGR